MEEQEARGEASQIFKSISTESSSSSESGGSKIFADRRWLQPTSEPPTPFPNGREVYVSTLNNLLAPAPSGDAGKNVYAVGPPGTGKTLTIRYVLDTLKEHVKGTGISVHVAYVNAGRTRSPYFTLLEIVRSLGLNVPSSGWQFSRLKEEFEKQRGGKACIIAIDEADTLLLKVREPLLYYLNRQENITLILITNRWDDLTALPARARSTLQAAPLIFQPYTAPEAVRILKERAQLAFKVGVADDQALDYAAALVAEAHDIRVGFNLLLTAGILAESQGRVKVDLVDLKRAERAIRPTL